VKRESERAAGKGRKKDIEKKKKKQKNNTNSKKGKQLALHRIGGVENTQRTKTHGMDKELCREQKKNPAKNQGSKADGGSALPAKRELDA